LGKIKKKNRCFEWKEEKKESVSCWEKRPQDGFGKGNRPKNCAGGRTAVALGQVLREQDPRGEKLQILRKDLRERERDNVRPITGEKHSENKKGFCQERKGTNCLSRERASKRGDVPFMVARNKKEKIILALARAKKKEGNGGFPLKNSTKKKKGKGKIESFIC